MTISAARLAGLLLAGFALAGPAPSSADAAEQARVSVDNGNIVVQVGSGRRALTNLMRDSEAVVSPDGQWVLYTRSAKPVSKSDNDDIPDCTALTAPDELRRIGIDGRGDELLLRGRAGDEPTQALCGFTGKQFSADGKTIYFLSPAWATSHALHALTIGETASRFILPGSDFAILSWCTLPELREAILIQQHRYFQFGGSYDWYWLFDASGEKEIGPVGEFESIEDIKSDIDASGQCTEN